MRKSLEKLSCVSLAATFLAITSASCWAQTSVNTIPSGFFTVTIPAGGGTSASTSFISFPLQDTATATGEMAGQVTSVTANTVTVTGAGWTAGQLSAAATPYLIQFTSGAAAGRTFLISTSTANTATVLTIDATDAAATNLTTLSITNTDTFQIIPADTISSVFGTPATTGILGGTSSASVDQVQLYSPASGWVSYYYNTNSAAWLRVGPPIASGNTVIRPDTGVIYARYGTTALSLTLLGHVSPVARQATVANSGTTVISNNWPVDQTLAGTNISTLSGWTSATSSANADIVQIYSAASGWSQYYYNGTHWLKVGPPINSDGVAIPAGTAVIIVKKGSTTGQSTLSQLMPYSI